MMVCMAGLQVFIVRFFFQVCCPSLPLWSCGFEELAMLIGSPLGREKGIRVNDCKDSSKLHLRFWSDTGKTWHGGSRNSVYN